MMVFLSHSFRSEDSELVRDLERLLSSHNILIIKGSALGGGQLAPEIWRRIDKSDGLIALKTRRKRVGDPVENRWLTGPWIDDEYSYARYKGQRAIAMVENGVEKGGAFENDEQIRFDRSDPLEAFLTLSEILRIWKDQIGNMRVVQIWPGHLGHDFDTNSGMKCRYRFLRKGVRGQWAETDLILKGTGTLLFLRGVRDDDDNDTLIEVEILQNQRRCWYSSATSQYINVEMQLWEERP